MFGIMFNPYDPPRKTRSCPQAVIASSNPYKWTSSLREGCNRDFVPVTWCPKSAPSAKNSLGALVFFKGLRMHRKVGRQFEDLHSLAIDHPSRAPDNKRFIKYVNSPRHTTVNRRPTKGNCASLDKLVISQALSRNGAQRSWLLRSSEPYATHLRSVVHAKFLR